MPLKCTSIAFARRFKKFRSALPRCAVWAADAAHQLKTPLAGLRVQADLAQREGADAKELKQSPRQIVRATHTVNQLLALARAESSGIAMPHQACDFAELSMSVIQNCVSRAIEKHIDLGYEGLAAGLTGGQRKGNPTLLKELVRNLVDNAIKIAQQHNAMVHLAETHVAQASPGARFSIRFSTEAAPL